jgi:hypothetical protein
MLKQIIGCPSPNFSARISQSLSFLLLLLLSTQFTYSPNAQASDRRPSLAQAAPGRSLPEAVATALGLPAARPEPKGSERVENAQEIAVLEPGKPIERELSGGQEHGYQISLAKGQYASIIVEQRGIDVVVELQEKEGRGIVSFDGEYRSQGEETVEMVGEATGSCRLSVRASSKSAPTGFSRVVFFTFRIKIA